MENPSKKPLLYPLLIIRFWYCIPLSESHKLENFAKQYFVEGFSKCKEFVRHKTVLINPYLLKQKIPDLIIHKYLNQDFGN